MPADTITPRESDILRRIAQGYTNKRIAEALNITIGTVKWYNQQIYAKLGVDNRTQATLRARDLGIIIGKGQSALESVPQRNFPRPNTSLIGREAEIDAIVHQLQQPDCRLLTLVGPGGSGKTRLAIEVAWRTDCADGVYFVPLQPLRASKNIVMTIVDILPLQLSGGDDPMQQLLDYLHDRDTLLILDNFEHLLDGVEIVTDILGAAPRVQLLVTSRERLNLRVEQAWPVSGLDVPEDARTVVPDDHSAVRLFEERARRARSDFSADNQRKAVIRICRLVDGLPLALELAATWVRVMSCEAIADEIQNSIDILSTDQRDVPVRHRSVRAVFEHSWDLLTQAEQITASKLAVFRGGFTADAVEQVADGSLPILAALIDKSIVQLTNSGRYDLHELVRQFAEERLEKLGQVEAAFDAHSHYYSHFMCDQHVLLTGARVLEALDAVAADYENIRAAWSRAVDQRQNDLLDCALDSLCIFCEKRSSLRDAIDMLQQARDMLAHCVDTEHSPLWGRLLVRHADLKRRAANPSQQKEQAAAYLADTRHALHIAQEQNDRWEIAFCLYTQGLIEATTHDFKNALRSYEQSVKIFTELQETYYATQVMLDQVYCFGMSGKADEAYYLAQKTADFARAHGNQINLVDALVYLAWNHLFIEGDLDAAHRVYVEALDLATEAEYQGMIIMIWFHSGMLAVFRGDFEAAASLAENILSTARRYYAHHVSVGHGNVILGLALGLQGDYRRSLQYGLEGRPLLTRPIWRIIADLTITVAAYGLGDYQMLSAHLLPLLQVAANTKRVMLLLSSLPCAAAYLAHSGRQERAAEILALACNHPKAPTGWFDNWPLLVNLHDELEAMLGSARFIAAWERGKRFDLLKTVLSLRRDLQPEVIQVESNANQALVEPLSPRELEVLVLVAAGLTNREIAEELFIGISTVKKHINHIYDKLNVRNRTRAAACARELNLLK